jgi:hypothetical protein
MATIRRRNNKWQVIIRKDNLKITYKTFSLKEDAVRWARETEVKIEQGLYQDLALSKTTKLKDVLAQYRDRVRFKKRNRHSLVFLKVLAIRLLKDSIRTIQY